MKIIQASKNGNENWHYLQKNTQLINPLVLVFGNRYLLEDENVIKEIKQGQRGYSVNVPQPKSNNGIERITDDKSNKFLFKRK